MKSSAWIVLLAAFMTIAFSAESGMVSFEAPSAYAKDDKSNDSRSKDDKSGEKSPKDDQSSEGKKVNLCHVPPGNAAAKHTIAVAESAVSAHLAHGDALGECHFSCVCPPGVSACFCPDGTAGATGPVSSQSPASRREIPGQ